MKDVLIIARHSLFRNGLKQLLEAELQANVSTIADNEMIVYEALKKGPEIVLFDQNVEHIKCSGVLKFIRRYSLQSKVIVVTSHHYHRDFIALIKKGIYGYLPINAGSEELVEAIQHVLSGKIYIHHTASCSLVAELKDLSERIGPTYELRKMESDVLSERERDVLKLVCNGYTDNQIAEELHISYKTVRNHVSNILHKLKVSNRTQASLIALQNNIIKTSNES